MTRSGHASRKSLIRLCSVICKYECNTAAFSGLHCHQVEKKEPTIPSGEGGGEGGGAMRR